jgi:Domain of unknown function (DUF4157)
MNEYDHRDNDRDAKKKRILTRMAIQYQMDDEKAAKKRKAAKLEISAANDAHEQHADAVAKKVVAGEDASILANNIPVVNNTPQTKEESTLNNTGATTGSDQLQTQLNSSKGGGQNLDATTQTEMGSKMGTDLSGVKIHTDSAAHDMSEGINAKAFAYGQDIYFKQGNFDTTSKEGKELLAHELAHTVQQKEGVSRKVQRQERDDDSRIYFSVSFSKEVPDLNGQEAVNAYIFKQIFGLSPEQLQQAGVNLNFSWTDPLTADTIRGKTYSLGIQKSTVNKITTYSPVAGYEGEQHSTGSWDKTYFAGLKADEQNLINEETDRLFAAKTGITRKITDSAADTLNRMEWNTIRGELLKKHHQLMTLPPRIKEAILSGTKILEPKNYDKAIALAKKLQQLNDVALKEYLLTAQVTDDFDASIISVDTFAKKPLLKPVESVISEPSENAMQKLDGLQEEYQLYKDHLKAVEDFKDAEQHLKNHNADNQQYEAYYLAQKNQNNIQGELQKRLQVAGYDSINAFEKDVQAFEHFFQLYTRDTALTMLATSQDYTIIEVSRYVKGSKPTPELVKLRETMNPFIGKWKEATEQAIKKQGDLIKQDENGGVMNQNDDAAMQIQQDVLNEAETHQKEYPILSYFLENVNRWKNFINALSSNQALADLLFSVHNTVLENINESFTRLNVEDPEIWDMNQAIEMSKRKLNIYNDSIFDSIITDKKVNVDEEKSAERFFFTVIQVGLGILSATGIGAAIGLPLLAGLGALTVSGVMLNQDYQDYTLKSAAAGSALDKEMALTSQEPSLGWLAFDLLNIVFDFAAAAGAFARLIKPAKAIIVATDGEKTAAAIQAYREAIQKEAERLFVNDVKQQTNFIERMTNKLDSEEFVKKIQQQGERREKLLADNITRANELRTAHPGMSDISISGQIRLEQTENKALLNSIQKALSEDAQAINRVYYLCGESENMVTALNAMKTGIGETVFGNVLKYNMTLRSTEGTGFYKLIAESGLKEADFKLIREQIGNASPSTTVSAFRKALRKRIIENVSTEADKGIGKILDITEELDNKTSGTLFEEWGRKNVDNGLGVGEKEVPYGTGTDKIKPDNIILHDDYAEFTDFKHYRVTEKFNTEAEKEIRRYFSAMKQNAVYEGKTIQRGKIVFSDIKGAQENAKFITREGKDLIKTYYIDKITGEAVLFI